MKMLIQAYKTKEKHVVICKGFGSEEIFRLEYPLFINNNVNNADAGIGVKANPSKKRIKNKKDLGGEVDMVKFSELKPRLELPEEKKEVAELKGKTFTIVKAFVNKSQFHQGEYAIVVCKQGKEEFYFTTSSSVLIKQLKEIIIPVLEKGETVETTIDKPKGKKYYTFA